MFFDSAASNTLKFYDGGQWRSINTGTGFAAAGANSDITSLNALTAINGASLAIGNSATTTLNVGGAATGALTATFGANTSTSTTTVQSGTGGLNLNASGTGVITANRPVVVTPTALPGGNTAGMIAVDSAASNTLKYNNGAGWVTVANSSAVSGTTGYMPQFTSASAIGNSPVFINGSNVGIGTTSASNALSVAGTISATGAVSAGTSIAAAGNISSGGNISGVNVYSTGSIGAGTTSPTRVLEVAGAARFAPSALPGSPGAGDLVIDSAGANALKYYNGSSWSRLVTEISAARVRQIESLSSLVQIRLLILWSQKTAATLVSARPILRICCMFSKLLA